MASCICHHIDRFAVTFVPPLSFIYQVRVVSGLALHVGIILAVLQAASPSVFESEPKHARRCRMNMTAGSEARPAS